ncbi:MAG: DUF2721 domain-containing protein [Candidatus Thioglobus sp.]|nr:MAG: DUF2721 domain-containing protein [Candidatus Thioglobus sp.]KAA0456452.1 MAG: DUF2721 domain-containing protein [Candidatus Thioglobus sp.]
METIATELGHLGVVLQLAIAPMILISGVGFVLSALIDRYGRAIGALRAFISAIEDEKQAAKHAKLKEELKIVFKRTKLLKFSIGFSVLSLLFISILVLVLFFMALLAINLLNFSIALFVISLSAFIVSLVLFMFDINLSLRALELEISAQ